MIAVVDYHKGNLKSVERGLMCLGADARITDIPREIASAEAMVLPGVGSFSDAATAMVRLGQMQTIRVRITEGVPFLGICLGLHLMFEQGVEGSTPGNFARGLGLLPGKVDALPSTDALGNTYKIPHVGWNSLEFDPSNTTCPLLKGVSPQDYFYFTHSYVSPETNATCATTKHSRVFPSVVDYQGYAFGVQFHPEKSSESGLYLLQNFLNTLKGA
jgi:glutamine amidotransferase